MKGTFFNKPLEWNIETDKESWLQGEKINGILRIKNHSAELVELSDAGVAIAYADIKKVHARTEGAMKFDAKVLFSETVLKGQEQKELPFALTLPVNSGVTDKKASYYLTYGQKHSESHLMLKVEPKVLFGKIISLMDTFFRFKVKEYKAVKNGVEYKLIPPTARDMANLDSLHLILSMQEENLQMEYDFQVKKLDTSGVTNKINKVAVKIRKDLTPREFSLGKDLINQDVLLKSIESVISEVKLKSVF